jgi:hypothetical protein
VLHRLRVIEMGGWKTVRHLGYAEDSPRRRRRRSLFRIVHARGAIPNEVGPTRSRATPALNQLADEALTPASQWRRRSLFRIVHARGGSLSGGDVIEAKLSQERPIGHHQRQIPF